MKTANANAHTNVSFRIVGRIFTMVVNSELYVVVFFARLQNSVFGQKNVEFFWIFFLENHSPNLTACILFLLSDANGNQLKYNSLQSQCERIVIFQLDWSPFVWLTVDFYLNQLATLSGDSFVLHTLSL